MHGSRSKNIKKIFYCLVLGFVGTYDMNTLYSMASMNIDEKSWTG
jgi:hypothetical protein